MVQALVRAAAALNARRAVHVLMRRQEWYAKRLAGAAAGSIVRVYRPLLRHCEFIAVTGSCGKTTTKELIAGVLGTRFRGGKSREGYNQHYHTATSLLRVRPSDRFNVQEVGIGKFGAGMIDVALRLIRPTIGVVTAIGSDHVSAFGSIDAIAREKRKLVESLPPHGTAILNADDPRVLAMRAHCAARVLTFGTGARADVRAEAIDAAWPDRLSFTARHGAETARVVTQLCGGHWVAPALAALTVGVAMGMRLADAAVGLRSVPPFANRMEPVVRDDGVAFVFDDAKTPSWTIPATFAFVRQARARRRCIVVGTISDYTGNSDRMYASAAKEALRSADHVVFVGSRASKSLPAGRDGGPASLHAFYAIDSACEHLAGLLRPGDLVLLKGTPADRLRRIFATPARADPAAAPRPHAPAVAQRPPDGRWVQAVIALGNPGERFRGTPHNVGWDVVDLLARHFGAGWSEEDGAWIAPVPLDGGTLLLLKPRCNVNRTGAALRALGARHGFAAADCVLVHDDLGLEPGAVRARERGNDGGHNGVRSVLDAFATIEVRRVKVGVGRPPEGTPVADFVLAPLPAERAARVSAAVTAAAGRVLTLLALREPAHRPLREARERLEAAAPPPAPPSAASSPSR